MLRGERGDCAHRTWALLRLRSKGLRCVGVQCAHASVVMYVHDTRASPKTHLKGLHALFWWQLCERCLRGNGGTRWGREP